MKAFPALATLLTLLILRSGQAEPTDQPTEQPTEQSDDSTRTPAASDPPTQQSSKPTETPTEQPTIKVQAPQPNGWQVYNDCSALTLNVTTCQACFMTLEKIYSAKIYNTAYTTRNARSCGYDFVTEECIGSDQDDTDPCSHTSYYVAPSDNSDYPDGNYQIQNSQLYPHFCSSQSTDPVKMSSTQALDVATAINELKTNAASQCSEYQQIYSGLVDDATATAKANKKAAKKAKSEETESTVKWVIIGVVSAIVLIGLVAACRYYANHMPPNIPPSYKKNSSDSNGNVELNYRRRQQEEEAARLKAQQDANDYASRQQRMREQKNYDDWYWRQQGKANNTYYPGLNGY